MGLGAGLYMYVVVGQKFTFAISSPDEFLYQVGIALTQNPSLIPVVPLLTVMHKENAVIMNVNEKTL